MDFVYHHEVKALVAVVLNGLVAASICGDENTGCIHLSSGFPFLNLQLPLSLESPFGLPKQLSKVREPQHPEAWVPVRAGETLDELCGHEGLPRPRWHS